MYYRIYDTRTQHQFVPSRFTGIEEIPRVTNVWLLDQTEKSLTFASPDLGSLELAFTVRGNPSGDIYRVEIFPDPTADVQQIEQIVAGSHVSPVQEFRVSLTARAIREVELSIYRVDRETAKRDVNDDAPCEWKETFRIRS